jgi:hypothetical protein
MTTEAGAASPNAATPDIASESLISPGPVKWVAELWIDPDWYSTQGALENMPSPGLPDIIPLTGPTALIGRAAPSRGIAPEIDCGLDTGVSRRHAELITDGARWWIEDLQSANGTFIAGPTGALPAMPIPPGKIELRPGQRVYLGAWTKLVVRPATAEEATAFDAFIDEAAPPPTSPADDVPDIAEAPDDDEAPEELATPAATPAEERAPLIGDAPAEEETPNPNSPTPDGQAPPGQ